MTNRVLTGLLGLVLTCVSFPRDVMGQSSVHSTIQRVQQRMVKVFGAGGIRRLHSYSTGFVVSPAGHVATVWSHVLDTEELTVVLADGRKVTAKVLNAAALEMRRKEPFDANLFNSARAAARTKSGCPIKYSVAQLRPL